MMGCMACSFVGPLHRGGAPLGRWGSLLVWAWVWCAVCGDEYAVWVWVWVWAWVWCAVCGDEYAVWVCLRGGGSVQGVWKRVCACVCV
jgi:hypothetical protein